MRRNSTCKRIINISVFLCFILCNCKSVKNYNKVVDYKINIYTQNSPTDCVLKHIVAETNRDINSYLETVDCNLFFTCEIKNLGGVSEKRYTCDEFGLFIKKIWSINDDIGKSKGLNEDDKKMNFSIYEYSKRKYSTVNIDSNNVYNLYQSNGKWLIFNKQTNPECQNCIIDTLQRIVLN